MERNQLVARVAIGLCVALISVAVHTAIGAPSGSPAATTTIDGKQLPPPDPAFGGVIMTLDESFDVGMDTRTSGDDKDYQPPFRFTGKLDKLTVKVEAPDHMQADLLDRSHQEALNKAQ